MVTSRWGKGAGSPNAFVGAMSVLAVLAGCGGEAPGIASETMPRPALVHRVALSAGATEHRFVGRVQALQSVPLAFEVSGVLASLAPREGDYFVAGERLGQLDPEPFALARRRGQVELELASLRLERAEAQIGGLRTGMAQTTYNRDGSKRPMSRVPGRVEHKL